MISIFFFNSYLNKWTLDNQDMDFNHSFPYLASATSHEESSLFSGVIKITDWLIETVIILIYNSTMYLLESVMEMEFHFEICCKGKKKWLWTTELRNNIENWLTDYVMIHDDDMSLF